MPRLSVSRSAGAAARRPFFKEKRLDAATPFARNETNTSKKATIVELVRRFLTAPKGSFSLFGPRGTGKESYQARLYYHGPLRRTGEAARN
jgi:hypothetical protein